MRVANDHQKDVIGQLKKENNNIKCTLKRVCEEKKFREKRFACKIKALQCINEQNKFEMKQKVQDTKNEKKLRESVHNDKMLITKKNFRNTLNNVNEAHRQKVSTYEDERSTLLISLGKTIQDSDDLKRRYSIALWDVKKIVKEQKTKIDLLENENRNLQKLLENKTEENKILCSNMETLESDRVTVTCQFINLQKECSEKCSNINDYEAVVEQLKIENDEMILQNNYCQRQLNLRKNTCKNYNIELELLKMELNICQGELNIYLKKNRKCRLRRILHI